MSFISVDTKKLSEMINGDYGQMEIIDVREADEFEIVRFRNSKNIPLGELQSRMDYINWDKKVIFVCYSGNRSRLGAEMASGKKEVYNLTGGISEYYLSGDKNNLEIDESKGDDYL